MVIVFQLPEENSSVVFVLIDTQEAQNFHTLSMGRNAGPCGSRDPVIPPL